MSIKLERLDNADVTKMVESRKNVANCLEDLHKDGALSRLEADLCTVLVGSLNDTQFVSLMTAFGEEGMRILELKGEIVNVYPDGILVNLEDVPW